MTQNLWEGLKYISLRYPNRIAIQYKKDDKWIDISYNNFRGNAASLSIFILKRNIKKHDRVAILLDNRPEWSLIFFASVSIGAVCVPLNPESSEKEIENILKNAECKIVFTSDAILSKKTLPSEFISSEKIVSIDSGEFKSTLQSTEEIPDAKIDIFPSDLACILYTSGTTDEPKGVMLSHKNLLSNIDSMKQLNLFMLKDSILSILPLHHAYPLTVTMLLPFLCGLKVIYPGAIRSEVLFNAMKETNPTFFIAVPQIFYLFYHNIKERLRKTPFPFNILFRVVIEVLYGIRKSTGVNLTKMLFYSLHSKFGRRLRLFVSGGAKLDEDVERMLFKLGFTILEGYGLTETSPALTMSPLRRPRIGSVGLPIPGVELDIKDKDKNGIGEVIVRGPNIMEGYYRRQELTAQVIKEGWFHTGDLGYIDKDGYIFLTGRLKEVIVLSSGLNIYPEEIEEVYAKYTPVKEMCVFEVPAKKGLEEGLILWAVVIPDLEYFRRFGEMNLRSVIKERFDNISRSLPPHKRIMGFSITLEELPRTLLGKVKRFAVKEMYTPKATGKKEIPSISKELSKEDLELMEEDIGEKIIHYLEKQTRVDGIVPTDLIELDLGIDSLGRIELVSGIEGLFSIKIEDDVVSSAFTVRDLIFGVKSLLSRDFKPLPSEIEEKIEKDKEYWKEILQVLPKKENIKKIDLKPGFGAWLAASLFIGIVYILFKIFYRLKVEGKEFIPLHGPCILYVNHTSYFDGFLMAVSVPSFLRLDLFFVGFRPYFNVPLVRNLIKIGRIIPLDFVSHLLEALRSSYYVLSNGKSVCLFPEGIRTLDGNINKFKKGFGILVKESKAKLVPVFIEGAYQAWPRTSRFPKTHPIKVKFGKAQNAEDLERKGLAMGAADSYNAICLAARDALVKLKCESQ